MFLNFFNIYQDFSIIFLIVKYPIIKCKTANISQIITGIYMSLVQSLITVLIIVTAFKIPLLLKHGFCNNFPEYYADVDNPNSFPTPY